ncbi:unnamed protein product [Meloidogyne enterolobii]|uniref:Uncharacterized protein n=1 Tax=Meloidogyne enterolobii TaxID=390850 RepID=A0ACB1AA89_MELEN
MAKFFFVFLLFVFIFINSSYCGKKENEKKEENPYKGPWKIHNTEEIQNLRAEKEKQARKWAERISKYNVKGKTRHDYDFSQNTSST